MSYFNIAYAASTVSRVLVEIPEYKTDGKFTVNVLIVANEAESHFLSLAEMANDMAVRCSATNLEIHPSVVYDKLDDASIQCCYDELGAEQIVQAVEHHINNAGSVDAITQICEIVIAA